MRIVRGLAALAFVAAFAAACSSGGGATPSAAATAAPTAAPSVEAPSRRPSRRHRRPTPARPRTWRSRPPASSRSARTTPPTRRTSSRPTRTTDPWELGDPTNGKGFESAVGFAIAQEMGFAKDAVTWVYTGFNNAIAPGPKDFDIYITQVSYSAERAQAVDISDGYYDVAQSLVVPKKSKFAKAATIADLKDLQFGAQVGTTSLKTITDVVAPSKEPKVYDTNDAAVEALKNGQIDGLVVDLPTASYVAARAAGRRRHRRPVRRTPRPASTSARRWTRTARSPRA